MDELTGKVIVKGQVEETSETDRVTLMLVKKGAVDVTKDDLGYVAQTTLDDNGNYAFDFLFKGNVDDYELRMMIDGEVATDTVTLAKADYSWVDTAVKIYQDDEKNVSSEVVINNYADIEGLTYQLCLMFYDAENRFIGVSSSQNNAVENTVTIDAHSAEIPEGTASIKAVAWSDFTKMIPLSEYDLATK